ncbi:DNA/RNA non-specific endonuclease [Candidatus Neptunochlamydia vexilliferae]|uniref:DNA/RNA non-specific endonuclease n=1 Tax=Candidatus Neptunichlamydia vexilliferae TaxID=1651774 RepID=UPI0018916CC1|nr:DNA/RNA non-specific endonuclease [Candidatus Neptunochlamydia vexilliferae]
MKKSIGFFAGVAVGVALAFSYQHLGEKPQAFPVLERSGYTVAYDTRAKIPFWTHEYLTEESLAKNAERKGISFQEDQEVYSSHRSTLSDYADSGFDRGHNVPAGDVRVSKEALSETFYLSNIAPQHPQFNRGIWRKLESHLRTLVKTAGSLQVVTGPLFLSHEKEGKKFVTYQVIGNNEVAVPTHFFKVIFSEEETRAYVIPNAPVSGEFESYRFPVEKIEKISGIHLDSLRR